jgi:hypothetical protein
MTNVGHDGRGERFLPQAAGMTEGGWMPEKKKKGGSYILLDLDAPGPSRGLGTATPSLVMTRFM